MGIQKCKNCGTQFKYKDLFQSFWPKNSVDCKNCGTSHEITRFSSFVIATLIIIPSFAMRSLTPNILLRLSVTLMWIIILVVLYPFIVKYKLKDRNDNNE